MKVEVKQEDFNWASAFFVLTFIGFYLYGFRYVEGWWWLLAIFFPAYTPYLSLIHFVDFVSKVILNLTGGS